MPRFTDPGAVRQAAATVRTGHNQLIQGDIDHLGRHRYSFGEFCRLEPRFWAEFQSLNQSTAAVPPKRAARFEFQKGSTIMANTSSAKKAARQMLRRTEVNKARRSGMRTEVRRVEEAIASGDKAAATSALRAAQPVLARAAQKGVIEKGNASRKVSRLNARIKAMEK